MFFCLYTIDLLSLLMISNTNDIFLEQQTATGHIANFEMIDVTIKQNN